jgi:hypothetical protein
MNKKVFGSSADRGVVQVDHRTQPSESSHPTTEVSAREPVEDGDGLVDTEADEKFRPVEELFKNLNHCLGILFGTRLQDLPVELVERGEGCRMGKIVIRGGRIGEKALKAITWVAVGVVNMPDDSGRIEHMTACTLYQTLHQTLVVHPKAR